MAQTKIITKENILKAGFLIIKEEGDNKLNARNLAKKLSCSTQPIYDSFKNMNVFHEELVNYVRKFYYGFVSENHNNEKSIYMKYIKNYIFFAKDFLIFLNLYLWKILIKKLLKNKNLLLLL